MADVGVPYGGCGCGFDRAVMIWGLQDGLHLAASLVGRQQGDLASQARG